MHVDFTTTHLAEGFPILLRAFPCTASHLYLHPVIAFPLSMCSTHDYITYASILWELSPPNDPSQGKDHSKQPQDILMCGY